jgi:hypothetical protein
MGPWEDWTFTPFPGRLVFPRQSTRLGSSPCFAFLRHTMHFT